MEAKKVKTVKHTEPLSELPDPAKDSTNMALERTIMAADRSSFQASLL